MAPQIGAHVAVWQVSPVIKQYHPVDLIVFDRTKRPHKRLIDIRLVGECDDKANSSPGVIWLRCVEFKRKLIFDCGFGTGYEIGCGIGEKPAQKSEFESRHGLVSRPEIGFEPVCLARRREILAARTVLVLHAIDQGAMV